MTRDQKMVLVATAAFVSYTALIYTSIVYTNKISRKWRCTH